MSALVIKATDGAGAFVTVWVENGVGFVREPAFPTDRWVPLTETLGIGGRVLSAAEVEVLVAAMGKPTVSP